MTPEYALTISACADWSTIWALEDAKRTLQKANSRDKALSKALGNILREIHRRKQRYTPLEYQTLRNSRYVILDLDAFIRSDPDAAE